MKEKIYVEINAFITDLKSDERYERKYDPLYVAIVNETEKNLRAWAAAEETPDVAPVVHGRWEVVYNSVGKQEGQCTHCGKNSGILITKKSYCPNCGAKMDEEEPQK